MDPSAAPWRVLESGVAPTADPAAAAVETRVPEPGRRSIVVSPVTAVAVGGAIVLAVAAFLLASSSAGSGAVTVEGGAALASSRGDSTESDPVRVGANDGVIVVEIVGAVRQPGVFRLPVGSRVGDLVEAAGGYGPRLDAVRAGRDLHLAARLADGDRVSVPSRDEAASSTSDPGPPSTSVGGGATSGALVDLNRATQAELEALPGIGPVTAAKIVTSREEQPFTAVDDLRTRKLLGAKTFDKLKDLVSVG